MLASILVIISIILGSSIWFINSRIDARMNDPDFIKNNLDNRIKVVLSEPDFVNNYLDSKISEFVNKPEFLKKIRPIVIFNEEATIEYDSADLIENIKTEHTLDFVNGKEKQILRIIVSTKENLDIAPLLTPLSQVFYDAHNYDGRKYEKNKWIYELKDWTGSTGKMRFRLDILW